MPGENFLPIPSTSFMICRYGTTSKIFPPSQVLNTELLGNNVEGIKNALSSAEPPEIIVVPRDIFRAIQTADIETSAGKTKKILQDVGLWKI
jgi:hypothetical protein